MKPREMSAETRQQLTAPINSSDDFNRVNSLLKSGRVNKLSPEAIEAREHLLEYLGHGGRRPYADYDDFRDQYASAQIAYWASGRKSDVVFRRLKQKGARDGLCTHEGKTFKTQHAEQLEYLKTQLAAAEAEGAQNV